MSLRSALRVAVAVGVVTATSFVVGSPAAVAQTGGERIDRFASVMEIGTDGILHVTESIDYNFGAAYRRGIFRNIPVRLPYDDEFERVYPISNIRVTGSPGTPTDIEVSDSANNKVIRIGDPDRTITGAHRYTITYDVQGSMNRFEGHDELYWNVTGLGWEVPIMRVDAEVHFPGATTKITCFAGPAFSTLPCDASLGEGTDRVTFTTANLQPFSGLTIVAGIPRGVIPTVAPILDERWSLQRAFAMTTATVASAIAILVVFGGLVIGLLFRHGRDRRMVGDVESVRPLLERNDGPVTYRPPDDLRPAQLGVLIDERADPLDVTASIVDLAVRGYLVIEEIPDKGLFSKGDWRLTRKDADEEVLEPYEKRLLKGLFGSDDTVLMSELKQNFYDDLKNIQEKLYKDCVKRGWFRRRPDHTRAAWLGIGIAATIVGIGAVGLLAAFTHAAVIGIPLVLIGLLVLIAHGRMPARTASGTETLRELLGFRRFMTEAQTERMQFAEEEGIFAKYLPYAIVFGVTKQWAKRFEGLDQGSPQMGGMGWYMGVHPFHVASFGGAMRDFTIATAGTIVSTPPSASGGSGFGGGGGFSGGGGGGGGGGSW